MLQSGFVYCYKTFQKHYACFSKNSAQYISFVLQYLNGSYTLGTICVQSLKNLLTLDSTVFTRFGSFSSSGCTLFACLCFLSTLLLEVAFRAFQAYVVGCWVHSLVHSMFGENLILNSSWKLLCPKEL